MIDQEEENDALHNSLIVVEESVVAGNKFYGPFTHHDYDEVDAWATQNLKGAWWIVHVIGITNPNYKFDNSVFDNTGDKACSDPRQLLLPFSPPFRS